MDKHNRYDNLNPNDFTQKDLMLHLLQVAQHSATREDVKDDIADMSALETRRNHVVVCGYSVVGKFVTRELDKLDASYIIIDNSAKHVKEALDGGLEAYLGDMSKTPTLNAIHTENAAAVIVTLDNIEKKRLVCEAVLTHTRDVNLIVKITSLGDKEKLSDLDIAVIVDGKAEVAKVLVDRMASCQLRY